MSLEKALHEAVADIMPPGLRMVVGIPIPPSAKQLKKGLLADQLRRVCGGLNKCGGMFEQYATYIVEVAPDKVNLATIRPYVDRLLPIFRDALSKVEQESLARETDRKILAPLVAELKATIALFESLDTYAGEEEPNRELLVEMLCGFGEDAKTLRDAYRAGGVPKAFETIIELGQSRGYELVNHKGELMFSRSGERPWPIQFVDDPLVAERVEELLEDAEDFSDQEDE